MNFCSPRARGKEISSTKKFSLWSLLLMQVLKIKYLEKWNSGEPSMYTAGLIIFAP